MKVILVGCSEGIQPTTDTQLENGTGPMVTNSLDPKLRENNYRIVKQSLDLFLKYVTAITKGKLEIELEILELSDLCIPISVSTTKPPRAYSGSGLQDIWENLDDDIKATTDWWWLMYPSHVPDYPDFDDNIFITGGMGLDYKGGPAFISDDKWIVRKLSHLGGGDYSDIERRAYLPQWFQHEFLHHLYRAYPEYQLEVNGHDWFNRDFWPADFEGQFESDFYTESLHKRLQLDCTPLDVKLITSVDNDTQEHYNNLSNDEFIGTYSLDEVQNNWHIGQIIKQNNKYYWKNNANIQWEVTPKLSEGILETGSDSPYPGINFNIKLYQDPISGDYIPGVTGLQFNADFYRKRFNMLNNDTDPMEIALGSYTNGATSGEIIKESGTLFWKTEQGTQWTLIPDGAKEAFTLSNDSPTPGEQFELILDDSDCNYDVVGFKYQGNQYLKTDGHTLSGVNLALGGTATQSSNYSSDLGLAQLAIDGNTSGVWGHQSVTHTQNEYRPWWQVRLDKDQAIGEIKIWNRTDCYATRLRNFDVFVYNEAGDLAYKETIADTPNSSITITPKGAIGSRVRIKLKDTNPLSLAEVQIYGVSSGGAPIGSTIAFRKSSGDALWVTAEKYDNDNQLLARGTGIYDWEKFLVEAHPDGGIALKSNATGKYVQVQGNHATKPVRATGNAMGTWEQFLWQDMGSNQMALQSMYTGKWLQANWNTSKAVVYPNGAAAKTWETFDYTIVTNGNKNITTTATQTFNLHPVPTSAAITISGTLNDRNTVLEIVDLKGGLLLRKQLDQNQTTIDISTFESGMYIARFYAGDGSNQSLKIIKN